MVSELDDVDRHILHLLQRDARRNITDIANEVGVSGNTVRNRIEQLEETGVIRGYSADIDYRQAGLDLHFAFLCSTRVRNRKELASQALDIPDVIEIREFMTGQENIYLEGVGTNTEEITKVAETIDEMGLAIDSERLIRNDFSKPLAFFATDGSGSRQE